MLELTRRHSPDGTEFVVVDNHSSDGTAAFLRAADIQSVRLPLNVGHGAALDVAAAQVDTEYLAVLDVDAFPIDDGWLDVAIAALNGGAYVAGAHVHRSFVHPCFLVMRTRTLHEHGLSFRPIGRVPGGATRLPLFLDVGESLAHRLSMRYGATALHRFEPTSVRGPGMTGTVFGGIVYHNFYSVQGAHRPAARAAWEEAIVRFRRD